MSRSGYTDDLDDFDLNRYRSVVARAIRGKRGQALLREMLTALDAMPKKKLIAEKLRDADGNVCAAGAVCTARGLDTEKIDPEDPDAVAEALGVARSMAAEIAWVNDELGHWKQTPAERFERVRKWVLSKLVTP